VAAPKRPGGRAGMGRPPGAVNKRTRQLKDLAGVYTAECVRIAAAIMLDETAKPGDRLEAIRILLDRAHGKPAQEIQHSGEIDGGCEQVVVVLPDNGR
jgi:hypothetical protein